MTAALSATPSMDITGSIDRLHGPLAPLASSETFSDVSSIYDEQPKQDLSTDHRISKSNKKSNLIIGNTDYDSLEILFDFPSADLSNEPQTNIVRLTDSTCRIRFCDNPQIINSTKV